MVPAAVGIVAVPLGDAGALGAADVSWRDDSAVVVDEDVTLLVSALVCCAADVVVATAAVLFAEDWPHAARASVIRRLPATCSNVRRDAWLSIIFLWFLCLHFVVVLACSWYFFRS